MSATTYRLVVKSPDDRVPAYSVVCLPSWCVRTLKEHIAEVYPSHPLPSNQRLINAGKLLKDDVLIKTLFKDPEEIQTVHLVCRTSNVAGQIKRPCESSIPTELPPAELERYQQQYYAYLQNFFLNASAPTVSSAANSPMVNSSTSMPSPQNFWYAQGAWRWSLPVTPQQLQLQQQPWGCWYHPAAYGYSATNSDAPIAAATPTDGDPGVANAAAPGLRWMQGVRAMVAEFTGVGVQEHAAEARANVAAPEDAPQPQGEQQQQAIMMGNPMMGGFMGAEEFGEGAENMDIVDRFYMLFRLCLFIGLCFAYSSLDKAIIVFSVAAYVYFYNIYRRHAAMRRAAAEAQRIQEQTTEPATDPPTAERSPTETPVAEGGTNAFETNTNDPDQQLRALDTSGLAERSAPQVPPAEPARMERLTNTLRLVFSTSYQFFFSLLTSLIPEQPPPIRLD